MDPLRDELQIVQSNSVIKSASAVAFAILYYDYALTFATEVERFWKRSCSRVSLVYYLNRALALVGHVPVLYEFYNLHTQSLQMYHQVLAGVMQVVVAALQIFRLYALYEASRKVLCLMLATAGVAIAIAGWAINQTWHTQTVPNVPHPDVITKDCDLRMSAREGKYLAIVWIAVLLCDTVFFALIVNRVRRLNRLRGRLFKLLLRDGAEYFAALLVCHLANILTCLVAPPEYRGVSVTITNVIASTLIARLMLNLRDPKLAAGSQCWSERESTKI